MSEIEEATELLELRVLSGRHAGARVPLSDGITLGRDDNADIILTDIDSKQSGSYLRQSGDRQWVLVKTAATAKPQKGKRASGGKTLVRPIVIGETLQLGGLKLCVCPVHLEWQDVSDSLQQNDVSEEDLWQTPESQPDEDSRIAEDHAASNAAEAKDLSQAGTEGELQETTDGAATANEQQSTQSTLPTGKAHTSGLQRIFANRAGRLTLAVTALAVTGLVVWTFLDTPMKPQATQPVAKKTAAPPKAPANSAPGKIPVPATPTRQNPSTWTPEQVQIVKKIREAIAQSFPGNALTVSIEKGGGAAISGWLANSSQFDQLADTVVALSPTPVLRVRVIDDLRYELLSTLSGIKGPRLDFQIVSGPQQIRIVGLALSEEDRIRKFKLAQSITPSDVLLINQIGLAEKTSVPSFQASMLRAGFDGTSTRWKEEALDAEMQVTNKSRAVFERTLVDWSRRYSGVPFQVRVRIIPESEAPKRRSTSPMVALPPDAVLMTQVDLPFKIRSVVSGPIPFILLDDGSRILLGGSRDGWRLSMVEPYYIVLEGPHRVTALR